MRKKCAFTLIEVLVVVAIIAVLAAILLPSLRTAREQAKRAKCAANLRTLAHVSHLYASEDRKGYLPDLHNATGRWNRPAYAKSGPGVVVENTAPYPYWFSYGAREWLLSRHKIERESLYCPSNSDWNFEGHWNIEPGKASVWGYIYLGNSRWLNDIDYMASANFYWVPPPDLTRMPITAYKLTDKPQRKILWADLTRSQDRLLDFKSGGNHVRGEVRVGDALPSIGGANIGFLDSHVEWRQAPQMKLQCYRVTNARYEIFW